jgi:hypothetical protein
MTRKVEDDDGERKTILTGFRVVRVFDVAQTSGEELPTISLPDVSGSSDTTFGSLVAAAAGEELDVEVEEQAAGWDGPRGWINHDERRITLVDFGQGLDNMTRTLLHELAHYCDPAAGSAEKDCLRPVLEVVAESAAMIVGTALLGLDLAEASATYLATWMEGLEVFEGDFMAELAEHTLRVARRLEAIVMPHLKAIAASAAAGPIPVQMG